MIDKITLAKKLEDLQLKHGYVKTPSMKVKKQSIRVSANRHEDEPWRIERMTNLKIMLGMLGEETPIARLHDHKGTLTVIFTSRPDEGWERYDARRIGHLWEAMGELMENVKYGWYGMSEMEFEAADIYALTYEDFKVPPR